MRTVIFIFLIAFCLQTGIARAVDLYLGLGTSAPDSQGYISFGGSSSAVHSSGSGTTSFDTTADNSEQAGFARNFVNPTHVFPTLDRTVGYDVTLDMQVLNQSSTSNDRAGISLIALSSDLLGVELAFYEGEVWVYDSSGSTFTHGTGHAFDTTAAMTTYDLAIHGSTYQVFANGNFLFGDNLHDYSARGSVYVVPNFIFLGDDTTEASGNFQFSRLSVTVPEPTSMSIVAAGAFLTLRRWR